MITKLSMSHYTLAVERFNKANYRACEEELTGYFKYAFFTSARLIIVFTTAQLVLILKLGRIICCEVKHFTIKDTISKLMRTLKWRLH